jgi:hypothetical protein
MLRDNLAGLIEPMFSSGGANPPALCTARKKSWTIDPHALKNRHTEGAESTLTENAASPFHAEPRQLLARLRTESMPSSRQDNTCRMLSCSMSLCQS